MRLKYTSFKSLTLKKKRKKKKKYSKCFRSRTSLRIVLLKEIWRFAPRLMSEAVRSVYWVKKWKNKKKEGGGGEKGKNGRSICFVDSTHYLNNCKLRNKYNYYCSFSIFESCFAVFFPSFSWTNGEGLFVCLLWQFI